jgi:hypothetical protein
MVNGVVEDQASKVWNFETTINKVAYGAGHLEGGTTCTAYCELYNFGGGGAITSFRLNLVNGYSGAGISFQDGDWQACDVLEGTTNMYMDPNSNNRDYDLIRVCDDRPG